MTPIEKGDENKEVAFLERLYGCPYLAVCNILKTLSLILENS